MTPDATLAALTAYVEAHPAPARRPLTSAEIAAEDYWAAIGEDMRDDLYVSESDGMRRQARYDNWVEGCA